MAELFGEINWKPRLFQRASVILWQMSGPLSHVWLPSICQAIDFETLAIFSFYLKFFWFLTLFWSNSFLQNMIFKLVFWFVQNVAFSDGLKMMHSAWKVKVSEYYVQQWVWHKFQAGAICFMDLLPKNVKKQVSSTFADSPKNFPTDSTKKANWALWRPLDFLKMQFRAFSGYARSWKSVLAKVLFGCRTGCFQLVWPLAITYYDCHHLYVSLKLGLLGRFLNPDSWFFS